MQKLYYNIQTLVKLQTMLYYIVHTFYIYMETLNIEQLKHNHIPSRTTNIDVPTTVMPSYTAFQVLKAIHIKC